MTECECYTGCIVEPGFTCPYNTDTVKCPISPVPDHD